MDITPIQELLNTLVEDRVKATLDTLIVSHRNGTLTATEALAGIATISTVRLLCHDLARRIKSPQ